MRARGRHLRWLEIAGVVPTGARARPSLAALGLLLAVGALRAAPARAAQLKGTVDAPAVTSPIASRSLGYTRTRVASRAAALASKRVDLAVFLTAKESGVIPPTVEPFKMSLRGLAFSPTIAACVFEGKVAFTNDDHAPATVTVGNDALGTIPPGETKVFTCTGEPGVRLVRVKEWPHMRAGLYVGTVGVLGAVSESGAFSLSAPQGKYELSVISESGVLVTSAVEIQKADVDVGRLSLPAPAEDQGARKEAEETPRPESNKASTKAPAAPKAAEPKAVKETSVPEKKPEAPATPKPAKKPAKPNEGAGQELEFNGQQ